MSDQHDSEDPHDAILELLEPGSKSKDQIVTELGDDFSESEVKHALGDLMMDNVVEEHPGIENHWRVADG